MADGPEPDRAGVLAALLADGYGFGVQLRRAAAGFLGLPDPHPPAVDRSARGGVIRFIQGRRGKQPREEE